MYFATMHDLFTMHGHGFYVWSAYGISLLTILTMLWLPINRHAHLRKEIAQQILE